MGQLGQENAVTDQNMANNSILLAVADPPTLSDVTQALGAEWETISVASEEDALGQFEKRTFNAFLVDFNLGSPDASDLLNLVAEKHPQTIRFLLAHEADLALVAAKVEGSPQILPKPVESDSLKSRIEEAVLGKQPDTEQPPPPETAPVVPPIYAEVLKALESPGVTYAKVGEIIARDEGLTSEILSLAKSSYLGLPGQISKPVQAVESLGLDAVRAAVMALQFLAEHRGLRPGYLSLDQLWQHSINVAQIARDLVLFETKDRALASQALTAGLLHDLGKVVLAKNFDDLYGRVHSLASKQPVAIWDIEKEMFGANHGEIGACLIGMWNMPLPIVDAAALHHEPPAGEQEGLTPLAAVHIANVLERELWMGRDEAIVAPIISATFLNELGLLDRLPVWRAAFANHRAPETEEAEQAQTEQPRAEVVASTGGKPRKNPLARRHGAKRRNRPEQSWAEEEISVYEGRHRRNWIYAGACVFVVLLTIWFRTQPGNNQDEIAYARTPVRQNVPAEPAPVVTTPESPKTEPPKSEPPKSTPTVTASPEPAAPAPQEPPAPTATTTPQPKPPASVAAAPGPAVTPAPAVAPLIVPSPYSQAAQSKSPYKINGIIFGARPFAIINGQTVRPGDEVDGATVIAITATSVTLQTSEERKTYHLR